MEQPTADSGIVVIAGVSNTINGSYVVGEALDSSNFLVLQVDVKTPGDYSIKTDTTNGIVFSGNYTFTQTGTQFIKIYGTGAPTQSGEITISISAGGGTATYNITVQQSYKTCAIENSFQIINGTVLNDLHVSGGKSLSFADHYLISGLTSGNEVFFEFFQLNVQAGFKPLPGIYTITTKVNTLQANEIYLTYRNASGLWVASAGEVHVYKEDSSDPANNAIYLSFCNVKFVLGNQSLVASGNLRY
jgi:hypothetical protein